MFVNELLPILKAHATTHAETMFLACQLAHVNKGGQSWVSHARISDETGISVRSSKRAAADLAKRGIIAISADCGVRTVYTFPCRDAQPAPAPEPVREPAPAPVVAKNATAAAPAPVAKPAPAPKPEPVPEPEPAPVATPEPAPAPAQPNDDNPSHVAAPVQQPVVVAPVATPAPAPDPVAKPQPEPAPAPAQQPVQQSAPTPQPAPMPALEPAPPTPRRITSARVAHLPDVDEAVRREVDARPIIRTPKPAGVDDVLWEKCQRLKALCAENTARSREQKAAAQRFEDGVTAATEQVARQIAAQDIAAARQRAAQDAAAAKPEEQPETGTGGGVIPGNGRNVEQQPAPETPAAPAPEKTTDGQNSDAARDSAVRDGCYPAGEKTNAPEPVAPDAAATYAAATAPIVLPAPVVVHESPESAPQQALPIICEPQPPAATPQQGELLPAPAKQSRSVKTVAIQGELLPEEGSTRGSCLPKNWYLPREWGVWAMERFGFSEDEVRYQADKFRDHWISTTRNSTKKNWFATWRNWMRKAHERGEKGITYSSTKKSKMTQALDNLANMKLDWEHPEKWNPFAEMTPEEQEAARKRDEARAAARIAEAARKRDEAKRNRDAE